VYKRGTNEQRHGFATGIVDVESLLDTVSTIRICFLKCKTFNTVFIIFFHSHTIRNRPPCYSNLFKMSLVNRGAYSQMSTTYSVFTAAISVLAFL